MPLTIAASSNAKFFTKRNSRRTALKWRETISIDNVKRIQMFCSQEMQRLNYLTVENEINNNSNVIEPLTFRTPLEQNHHT